MTAKELGQYYTAIDYAHQFYQTVCTHVDIDEADIVLEPSAGTGSFYNLLPSSRIGLDLEPKAAGIIQQDFFTWHPPRDSKVVTIGNPPFGKNANLAVKFFNHAAQFSDTIAFILPRTFRKASVVNRLHKDFHCVYDETVPDNSFVYNGKEYNVWCAAQIWVRKSTPRPKMEILSLAAMREWFEITTPQDADFAIQRVGGRAGLIRTVDFRGYSDQSHYFIKQHCPSVLETFLTLDFDCVKYNTAGNPSISPSELALLWHRKNLLQTKA